MFNFAGMKKVCWTIIVSMDVTSLYTNIPQEEGINTICIAYDILTTKIDQFQYSHLSKHSD